MTKLAEMTTRCHSLLLVCYTLSLVYHSSSFVITRCHSLSLVVIRCHLLSFAVTRCTTHCPLLSLVVIRCHSLYYSLSFDVLLVSLFINNLYIKSLSNIGTQLGFFRDLSECYGHFIQELYRNINV